jgi:outer membrane receptor protein involved in Fe transport
MMHYRGLVQKIMLILFCIGLGTYSFAAGPDNEENSPDGAIKLDTILVTGEALRDDMRAPNMTVIFPSSLLQGVSSTLDGALKRQAGIDVQRPQEVGASLDDDSIKIRGFGSRRINVTVDGRSLNTPGTAGGYFVDWTTIPLSNVEQIEVIKGVSDPRYGNMLGGAVNLVTKKPLVTPVVEAQAGAGSFNTRTFDFYHGWKPGKFEYSVSAGYSKSDGYLLNGDFWIKNAGIHLGYELPWQAKILGDIQYVQVKKGFIIANRLSNDYDSPNYNVPKDRRYPASDGEIMYGGMGFRGQPERGSWWEKEKTCYSLGYEQTFTHSLFNARYWENYGNREAFNTRAVLNRVYHKKFYDDRSYGVDTAYKYDLSSHTVTMGVDYKRLLDNGDKSASDDFRTPFKDFNYVNSTLLGIFLMDEIFFMDRHLVITPGVRYMSYDGKAGAAGSAEGIRNVYMDGIAPSLKAAYNYGNRGLVYMSMARALRMPTPPEHYWHYSPDAGVFTGNLPLNKEDGLVLQGGWKTNLATGTKIEVAPYYYLIKNYIQFDLINFVSYNIHKATIYGAEFGLTQQLTKSLSGFTNYTYQKSRTEGDPFVNNFVNALNRDFKEIPGLPEHKVNAGIQYKGTKKEKIVLYATYVSSQKVIYNNNVLSNADLRVRTQDAYFTVDVEGSYPVWKGVELTAYVHNLFDENYQERFGFPAAERNFGMGVRTYF